MPLISIVMPCLDASGTIERALRSVEAQEDGAVEIVVADGGSADGTREIAERHSLARLLEGGDDGLYAGLNRAIAAARGDFVLLLNADDELPAGTLAAYREAIAPDSRVELVTGEATIVGDRRRTLSPIGPLTPASALFAVPAINARLYRRDLFERTGFDPAIGLAADRHFLYRLAKRGPRSGRLARPVYIYHAHEGSLTLATGHGTRQRLAEADRRLSRALLKEHAGHPGEAPELRRYAALQDLRVLLHRAAAAAPALASLPHVPGALREWARHRGKMAGW